MDLNGLVGFGSGWDHIEGCSDHSTFIDVSCKEEYFDR
jgi:hypothetical protein